MIVYRLSREKYKSQLSGRGAAIHGGRWNKKGTEVIYTSSSRALAMAEVLVHFSLQNLPDDYFMLSIFVPDSFPPAIVSEEGLPRRWAQFPYFRATQNVCDQYFSEKNCGLIRTPSAVVKGDFNYLINPYYRDFNQVKIVEEDKFPFDGRLTWG